MASKLKTPNHYVAGKTLGSLLGLCQNQIGGFFLYVQCQDNRKSVGPVFSVRTIERAKHNSLFLCFSLSSDKDQVQMILSSLFLSLSFFRQRLGFDNSLFLSFSLSSNKHNESKYQLLCYSECYTQQLHRLRHQQYQLRVLCSPELHRLWHQQYQLHRLQLYGVGVVAECSRCGVAGSSVVESETNDSC